MATSRYSGSNFLPGSVTAAQIQELLRSHGPPPEYLPSTVSALSDELTRLDHEISQLQDNDQLRCMKSERVLLDAHYDACLSVLAPIRRVPSEILVDIFRICLHSSLVRQNIESRAFEMASLARAPLFTVSQVCARWHNIVMGTPALWTTIELDSLVWADERQIDAVMELLKFVLERSGTSPLNVSICDETHPPALQLLATHSNRWKNVEIMCSMSNFQHLASVRGRLPLLETVMLDIWGTNSEPVPMDFFAVAPTLKTCIVSGELFALETVRLPIDGLHTLGCIDLVSAAEMVAAVAAMSVPAPPAKFQLQFNFHDWAKTVNPANLNISSAVSGISALSIDGRDFFSKENCLNVFNAILPVLTLPVLQELSFESVEYQSFPIYWPHSEFLAISARSSFDCHLHTLRLTHVVITESDLLESLSVLPLLQRLEIADHQFASDGLGANQHLITSSLFASLTRTPDSSSLVHDLRYLSCWSLLQFDDTDYLDFLLSRLQDVSFETELWSLPGCHRALDPSVSGRLRELRVQRKLVFSFYDSLKNCEMDG
ncbi:hypothetical protein B0H11DRAFT_2007522 [Mycena galericulata]|nr:hypothetical protein B0H11DRAFT_2007522 [Mycena galericulata]